MQANAQVQETIVKLVPGGEHNLAHLSDAELLTSTRRLVGASNKVFAALLVHLAEVEARGLHRTRACASLYTYCIYELRMSEDAAARRSSAARLVKAFPPLFDAIAAGELHLTGVLMLGPHLSPENHVEVLARAKFRTKKELAKLVRELHPLPQVPDEVEPLGPELPRALRAPTWEQWVASLCPAVRELPAGERPSDWANDTVQGVGKEETSASGPVEGPIASLSEGPTVREHWTPPMDDEVTAPARCELPPITAPQQFRMQFSATEEHVKLVERAKALLARTSPGCSLGELHQQALQLLVAKLEKEKFAVTERPRRTQSQPRQPDSGRAEAGRAEGRAESNGAQGPAESRHAAALNEYDSGPEQPNRAPRRRVRHVPAAVKREVFARDAGRCSYVDERGVRCRETRYLELHHLRPFAQGGEHVATNLALRCAAHNALAAEEDFGRSVIEHKRHQMIHHSLTSQSAAGTRKKGKRGAATPRG